MEMALEGHSQPRGGEKQVAPDTNLLLQTLRDLKFPQSTAQTAYCLMVALCSHKGNSYNQQHSDFTAWGPP